MNKKNATKEFAKIPNKKYKPEKETKNTKRNKLIKAIELLQSKYDFMFNVDTSEVEIKRKNEINYNVIDDITYRYMRVDLDMNNIFLSDDTFRNIIYSGYFFDKYHPFKNYLYSLPKWDKIDYMREFCQQVYLTDEKKYRDYFIEGFKKWFVALVVSMLEDEPHPYKINQTCMVFAGKQGKFKSTFFANFLPPHLRLRYYYSGIYDFHSEEHQKYLGTKILINLEELAGFNRGHIEAIKNRITQHQVSLRLKWGKAESYYKRRASFVATTNDSQFLNDSTGSRRFFTIPVEKIIIDETFNIDNIYRQALALYRNGFKYWFDEDDIEKIELLNEDFKIITMEEEMIISHFKKPTKDDFIVPGKVSYVLVNTIANWLAKKYERLNINNSVIRNLGRALSKYGYKKVNKRINGSPRSVWAVIYKDDPFVSDDVDNDNQNEDII